jgi:hypothetical protein
MDVLPLTCSWHNFEHPSGHFQAAVFRTAPGIPPSVSCIAWQR